MTIFGDPVIPVGSTYIGYNNELEGVTVLTGSADADFPVANSQSWKPIEKWRFTGSSPHTVTWDLGSARTINSYGFYHYSFTSVQVEYSADNVIWNNADAGVNPAASETIYKIITPQTVRYWRATFVFAGSVTVGVAFFSNSTQLLRGPEVGFSPPTLARDPDIINSTTEGGLFLGRSVIRNKERCSVSYSFTESAWIRTDWLNIVKEIEIHPFFYGWRTDEFPLEVCFGHTEGKIRRVEFSHPLFMRWGFDFTAFTE